MWTSHDTNKFYGGEKGPFNFRRNSCLREVKYFKLDVSIMWSMLPKQLSYLEKRSEWWRTPHLEQNSQVECAEVVLSPRGVSKTPSHSPKLLLMSSLHLRHALKNVWTFYDWKSLQSSHVRLTPGLERDWGIWCLTAVAAGKTQISFRQGGTRAEEIWSSHHGWTFPPPWICLSHLCHPPMSRICLSVNSICEMGIM